MVSAREDEVADETFVAVNDEVSAEFFWFLMALDQVSRGHTSQITPH